MGGLDLSQVAKFAIWDWVGCWAVDCLANAMQGHCNVNPIFCLLGDFCSVTNFFSLSCRNGRRRDKNPEEADCK